MAIFTGAYAPLSSGERAALEAKIVRSNQEFIDLTTQLNADAPIGGLPDSVLLMVFRQYIADLKEGMVDTYSTSPLDIDEAKGHPYYTWIRITHVCRRWRDIALRTPVLWTNLKVTSAASVEAFLERCGHAPIHIEGYIEAGQLDEPRTEVVWRRILQEAHRTASLHVALGRRCDIYPEDPKLGYPEFPALKSLWLLRHDSRPGSQLPLFMRTSQRFAGLEDFQADSYHFSIASPLYSDSLNLTRLSLSNFHEDSLTWPTLLEVLGHFKLLQRLTLRNGLPTTKLDSPNGLPPAPADPIAFPHLRELDLSCHIDGLSCAFLLQNVVIPSTATLRMSLGSPQRGNNMMWRMAPPNDAKYPFVVAPFISWLRNGGKSQPVSALQLGSRIVNGGGMPSSTCHYVKAYNSALQLYRGPNERPSVAREVIPVKPPRFETTWGNYSIDVLLRRIPILPCFRNITCLILGDLRSKADTATPRDVDTWFEVFGQLAAVRRLIVHGRTSRLLPAALATHDRLPEYLFPKLQSLRLFRAVFKDLARETEEEQMEWYKTLRNELVHRLEKGMGITEMMIEDARNIDEDMFEALEKVVPAVDWDGITSRKPEPAEHDEYWWADRDPEQDGAYIADYPFAYLSIEGEDEEENEG